MTLDELIERAPPERQEAWRWWEARRLRYNIALALAGWSAYAAFILVHMSFGSPLMDNSPGWIGLTVGLGVGYLVLMLTANVFYLLGVLTESIARPKDVDVFRDRTWALGHYASIALPFLFPLANFAILMAQSGRPL
jgi:hypothetical protein